MSDFDAEAASVTDADIAAVITAMSVSFDRQASAKHAVAVANVFREEATLPTPEDFYFKHLYEKSDEIHEVLRELIAREGLSRTESHRAVAVYENYSFLKSNVSSLMQEVEGSACSVDKTRTILSLFVRHEIQVRKGRREVVPVEYEVKGGYSFAYPKAGTMDAWFVFVGSLLSLQSGYQEPFIKAREGVKSLY